MTRALTILRLLWTAWSGSHLRRIARDRIAERLRTSFDAPAGPDDYTDPVAPVPPEATPQGPPLEPAPPITSETSSARIEPFEIQAFRRLGYRLHQDGRWNVYAVRNTAPNFDRYRCYIGMARYVAGKWEVLTWPATTYPGRNYTVDRLLNPRGTAILQAGQYRDTYRLRLHRQIYQALCQDGGPVRVYRDGNRDQVYDLDPLTIDQGYFGINIHAPVNPDSGARPPATDRIGAASAGCIVFASAQDFADARDLWREDAAAHGNVFDFTLLRDVDLDHHARRPVPLDMPDVAPQTVDPGTWHPVGTQTLGVRNRNLLNVKQDPANPWRHSTGADARGHTVFPNYEAGLRAGVITLRTYWTRHQLRTVAQILARWAPASDTVGSLPGGPANSPAGYARFVAARIGIQPNDRLMTFRDDGQLRSPDQLYQLVAAMVEYENYTGLHLPRNVFDAALDLV